MGSGLHGSLGSRFRGKERRWGTLERAEVGADRCSLGGFTHLEPFGFDLREGCFELAALFGEKPAESRRPARFKMTAS